MNELVGRAGTAGKIREYPARLLTALWILSSITVAALGPFATFENFGFLERLTHWAFAIGLSIVVGLGVNRAAQVLLGVERNRFFHDLVAVPALMVLYVPMLYLQVNHYPLSTFKLSLWFIAAHVFGISLVLIALREYLGFYAAQVRQRDPKAPESLAAIDGEPAEDSRGVPLLERLPEAVRGVVLHIAADNHRIEVRTERGATAVLMRLSDAIRELGEQSGLRVHRSHWVSDCAVARLQRVGARLTVVLTSGARVPVSRAQSAAAMQRWGHLCDVPPSSGSLSA